MRAGTFSPRVPSAICCVLVGLLLCGHVVFGVSPEADLALDAAEARQCEAFSHFACGLLQQFDETDEAFARADGHLREALSLAPASPAVAEVLVYPLLMRRDFDGVVQALAPAMRAAPGSDHLFLLAAEAMDSAEKPKEAVVLLERGLREGRWRSGKLVRRLFVLLWELGERRRAERLLARAGRKSRLRDTFDFHCAAAFHAGEVERERAARGLPSRARDRRAVVEHAERAAWAATEDDDPDDIAFVAELLADAGRWMVAGTMLDVLADRYDDPGLWLLKAEALIQCGVRERGVAYLEKQVSPYLCPESLATAADILVDAGQDRAAVRMLRRHLAANPDSLPARLRLAWIHYAAGEPSLGLEALGPLAAMPPEGLLLAAYLYRDLGHDRTALRMVERAKARARKDQQNEFLTAAVHLFCSSLHEANGDIPAAIRAARAALAMAPDNPDCANALGYLLADSNRSLAEAEGLVRAALAKDGDNPAYLDSLAWALHRQGRQDAALATIEHALRNGGDEDPVVLDHAGDICAAAGLVALARTHWIDALAAEPPDPDGIAAKLHAAGVFHSGAVPSQDVITGLVPSGLESL